MEIHGSAPMPRRNYLFSLACLAVPVCRPMCLLGFISSWLGKAKQQQFGSAPFGFCTALGMKPSTRVGPGHGAWMCTPTHSPRRERAGNGRVGSGHWIWAVSDKHLWSPPLPALDFTELLSSDRLSQGQAAIQPQSSCQGNPQAPALITSLHLGPSAERKM